MRERSARSARQRVRAIGDGVESLGLVVLCVALPVSEAMKSLGLALAAAGLALKLSAGSAAPRDGRAALVALGGYFLAAAVSVIAARPGFRVPGQLFTLAMALAVYPIVLDACSRRSRRVLLAWALVVGAVAASLAGYVDYMQASYVRLHLPSIENAVPAAEYLGAVLGLALSLVIAECRSPIVGPCLGFCVGALATAILMTKSRGPIVGTAVAALTAVGVGLRRRRAALALLAALVAAAGLFAVVHPDARVVRGRWVGTWGAASRLGNWRQTSLLVAERPITGHGLGSFARLGIVYRAGTTEEHEQNAHQLWLHLAAETGLLGCGMFTLFLVLAVRDVVRALGSAPTRMARAVSVGALSGIAALLVTGLFSVTTDAEPGMLLMALAGLGASGIDGAPAGRVPRRKGSP